MRKKFFPRNARAGGRRGQTRIRSLRRFEIEKDGGKVRNLREEFDILAMRECSIEAADELDRLWREIAPRILERVDQTLEEIIRTHITRAHQNQEP